MDAGEHRDMVFGKVCAHDAAEGVINHGCLCGPMPIPRLTSPMVPLPAVFGLNIQLQATASTTRSHERSLRATHQSSTRSGCRSR